MYRSLTHDIGLGAAVIRRSRSGDTPESPKRSVPRVGDPIQDEASASKPRPRPRPRPTYKGAQTTGSDSTSPVDSASTTLITSPFQSAASGSFPHFDQDMDLGPSSIYSSAIGERAKMRSRGAKMSSTSMAVTSPLPSTNVVKAQDKPSANPKPFTLVSEVINITSDEEDYDELALLSPSREKLLEKKLSKRKTDFHETLAQSSRSSRKSRLTTPPPLPSPLTDTRHPLSDSPFSIAPAVVRGHFDHPPIAVLPDESDASADMGSPSSLFSPVSEGRKRKRVFGLQSDDDFMGETGREAYPEAAIIRQRAITPPPPFFASSSASDIVIEPTGISTSSEAAPSRSSPKKKPKATPKKRKKRDAKGGEQADECCKDQNQPKPKPGSRKQNRKAKDGKKQSVQLEVVIQKSSIPKGKEAIEDTNPVENLELDVPTAATAAKASPVRALKESTNHDSIPFHLTSRRDKLGLMQRRLRRAGIRARGRWSSCPTTRNQKVFLTLGRKQLTGERIAVSILTMLEMRETRSRQVLSMIRGHYPN